MAENLGSEEHKDYLVELAREFQKTGQLSVRSFATPPLCCLTQHSAAPRLNVVQKAERLFLAADEHDMAIEMYKDEEKYDRMLHLVREFR